MCLYDRMHRRKIPHHCSPLLSSGPDKEDINDWCQIRRVLQCSVRELVKYQVQLVKMFLLFQES